MREDILNQVRKEYKKLKKEILLKYKENLLKNDELNKDNIVLQAFNNIPDASSIHIIDSNHLAVYMGSYIQEKTDYGNNSYLTYEGNPNTDYKSYIDIETDITYNIELDRCEEFESFFTVLHVSNSYQQPELLKKVITIKNYFKKEIMERSQQDVVNELQVKYKQKCKQNITI